MIRKSRLKGQTVVVIASGPSLTRADCKLIENSGLFTIAVNNAWELARFCAVLYAGDASWWSEYHEKIDIETERWCCSLTAGLQYNAGYHKKRGPYNSGMRAIQWAMDNGAEKVLMVGFDCSLKNGVHYHGKHKKRNPKNTQIDRWKKQFREMKKSCEIINCSRYSEIDCFERLDLEKALESLS